MDGQLMALGREAVDRLDSVLRQGADVPHSAISDAMRATIAFRDCAIAKHRTGGLSPADLGRANAIVSLGFGGEFPLSGLHLRRIEGARDALAALLDGR